MENLHTDRDKIILEYYVKKKTNKIFNEPYDKLMRR